MMRPQSAVSHQQGIIVNSEKAIELEGTIMMVLPGTMFRVALANDHLVLAHISGKMRKRFIRLTIGDRVRMEMSPYDTAKARIVYRLWHADEIPLWSAATPESKDGAQYQKPAGALSFNVEADGYRQNNRRKTLANSETENTKGYLCALRRRALLEKERRYSWTGHVNEPVIHRKILARWFSAFRSTALTGRPVRS
jgi:translation initiation factor IF-1